MSALAYGSVVGETSRFPPPPHPPAHEPKAGP
jgi:hypothetical protein